MLAVLRMDSLQIDCPALPVESFADEASANRLHRRWTVLLDGAVRCLARWRPCMESLALWLSDMTTFYRLYHKLSGALERCHEMLSGAITRGLSTAQCDAINDLVDEVCIHAATLDAFLRHESYRLEK